MTIDITPEAVERLAASLDRFVNFSSSRFVSCEESKTLRALSAALTAAQAETAAAYEAAAMALDAVAGNWACGHDARNCDCHRDIEQWTLAADECRALTPADSKAALDRMIAEARADGMREAAAIARQALVDGAYIRRGSPQETPSSVMFLAETLVSNAILAAITKGKDHE